MSDARQMGHSRRRADDAPAIRRAQSLQQTLCPQGRKAASGARDRQTQQVGRSGATSGSAALSRVVVMPTARARPDAASTTGF